MRLADIKILVVSCALSPPAIARDGNLNNSVLQCCLKRSYVRVHVLKDRLPHTPKHKGK